MRKFLSPGNTCLVLLPFREVVRSTESREKRHRSLLEKCGECRRWRTDAEAAVLLRESSQSYEAAHTRPCLLSL